MTTTTRKPTPAQHRAIVTTHPFAVAVAGPGSGKTTTLVARIQHLITTGTDPEGIVAITYTNAAAAEIQQRLGDDGRRLGYLGTLHGYALRELQLHGRRLGYHSRITVLDAEQAEEMLLEIAEGLGVKGGLKKLEAAREVVTAGRKPSTPAEIAVCRYFQQLRAASAVDFDTILADFLKLLNSPDGQKVDHLIVDEWQDSGDMDVYIYSSINARNRFYVGDPDQAIYGFRGGRVHHFLRLLEEGSGWEVHRLFENFRCCAMVCEAANRLIGYNRLRVEKQTVPPAGTAAGRVLVMAPFVTDDAERVAVLDMVRTRIESQPANEIAVLCRGNKTVREFTEAAEAMGIPVRKRPQNKLPEDWRVARAALELLNAPNSDLAASQWLRVRYPDQHVGFRQAAARNQWQLARVVPDDVPQNATVLTLASDLVRLGISRESILRILHVASQVPDASLAALSFAIARDFESIPEEGHGVTFTTLHGAKGREWGTVFLVACEQELCPGTSAKRDVEEERRLFFVGITRAKERLVMTSAGARRATWGNKRHQPATPSQFLAEIDRLS